MLQISEVARRLSLNRQTIYFYERIGLIPPLKRSKAGYRLFEEQDMERLSFICRAKALGLTLEEIREILTLQEEKVLPCGEIHARLLDKVQQLEETITRLQELKGELLPLVHLCEDNLSCRGSESGCIVFET